MIKDELRDKAIELAKEKYDEPQENSNIKVIKIK